MDTQPVLKVRVAPVPRMSSELHDVDDLEDRRFRTRHKVVQCRKRFPAYLTAKHDKIAKKEAALLKRELDREAESIEERPIDPDLERSPNESFAFPPSNYQRFLAAVEEAKNVRKVIDQIKRDEIHVLTRQATDSAAILEKIRNTNIENTPKQLL